ncbi:site-2 protease family protein [Actinocorallia populi]|uniref:site-2 protease family protein n=1 Tax=Actinocorallia populi TaxID=2079200 RepID=UPI001300366D|nr:site-2 protease family protein [Actinocorallia populi]
MSKVLPLGRVSGIRIGAQWSALFIVGLVGLILATGVLPRADPGRPAGVYWAVAVPVALVFFACLLVHELAHSLVALRRGVRVHSITLWMLGGVSELEDEAPTPQADLAIAAAGPLASFALGVLFGAGTVAAWTLDAPALLVQPLTWLALMNVLLGAFNLLPGAPLDGGRVLRAILWRRYHDLTRADLAAVRAGRSVGLALVVLGAFQLLFTRSGAGLWTMLVGWFLMISAKAEGTARLVRDSLRDVRVGEVMNPAPDLAPDRQEVGDFLRGTVAFSRQNVFPVVDVAGSPVGAVHADVLTALPEDRRAARVRDHMTALPDRNVLAPDAPAAELLAVRPVERELVAVVVGDGRVVGMITTTDLSVAYRRGLLLHPSGRSRPPAGGPG